jgi:hypothetical protein
MNLKLNLSDDEYSGLVVLSRNELRNPPAQARLMIRQELERRGLIQPQEKINWVKVDSAQENTGQVSG